jgi:hypothetical protein
VKSINGPRGYAGTRIVVLLLACSCSVLVLAPCSLLEG